MYRIEKYTASYYNLWNDFIQRSKNGTFLFHRDFMEYHSDRFNDFSLLVLEGEKLLAVLPAHISGNEVFSHYGLTYGGLVFTEKTKLTEVIAIFGEVLCYLHSNGIEKLSLKEIPSIYHKYPAGEFAYALFLVNALLSRRDSLSVIDNNAKLSFTKDRKQSIRRGEKHGLKIVEEPRFELFWNEILIPNLAGKHNIKPVHSLEEIMLLHKRFPQNIRHFNVYHNDTIVAGTTVFVTDTVAHPQYISGNTDKNELGSLDYLYDYLINTVFPCIRYFDFGISNEQQGRKLNHGLVFWKESFGARTFVQDFYVVNTANYHLLNDVII